MLISPIVEREVKQDTVHKLPIVWQSPGKMSKNCLPSIFAEKEKTSLIIERTSLPQ